jgi:hypothetical protein
MSDVRTVYARARAETAKLLGYGDDLDGLPAEASTRLDVACALRIALDDQAAKLLRGESTDVAKLLSASEALAKLLPATVLASPPPPANAPDPRAHMWAVYKQMRDRGAIHGEGYDGKVRRIAELEAEVAELEAALAGRAPGESTVPPLPDNVVSLRNDTSESAVPKSASPAPSKPAPAAPDLIDIRQGYNDTPEPWRGFIGGRPYDRWSDNRE